MVVATAHECEGWQGVGYVHTRRSEHGTGMMSWRGCKDAAVVAAPCRTFSMLGKSALGSSGSGARRLGLKSSWLSSAADAKERVAGRARRTEEAQGAAARGAAAARRAKVRMITDARREDAMVNRWCER